MIVIFYRDFGILVWLLSIEAKAISSHCFVSAETCLHARQYQCFCKPHNEILLHSMQTIHFALMARAYTSTSQEQTQQKENFSIESQTVANCGLLKVDKRDCQNFAISILTHSKSYSVPSMLLTSSFVRCILQFHFLAQDCCISIGLLH